MDVGIGPDSTSRIAELRAAARSYRDRYGELDGMVDLAAADGALAARRRRLGQLAEEYERIGAEMRSMESEVVRIERWMEFCLEDVLARAREAHAEGWSPTPVLGYRIWGVGGKGLRGVKMVWRDRRMTATCLSHGGSNEIPHTDGRCGRLGCGVYAAKSIQRLYRGFEVAEIGDVALGLVALTGKVVEHESGYRAGEATVIALGASMGEHVLLTSDPKEIDRVFAKPAVVKQGPIVAPSGARLHQMETYIEGQARRSTWTLVSSSE